VRRADADEQNIARTELVGDAVEFRVDLPLEEEVRLLEGVVVSLPGPARLAWRSWSLAISNS
jgi:hypothetical protein